MNIMPSDNHLCNSLTTQGLAAHKLLLRHSCECVEDRCDEKEDGTSNQARSPLGETDKLDTTKDGVDKSAHRVGCKTTDKGIEFR